MEVTRRLGPQYEAQDIAKALSERRIWCECQSLRVLPSDFADNLEKSILGADLTIRKNPNSILGKVQLEIIRDYMHYMRGIEYPIHLPPELINQLSPQSISSLYHSLP